MKEFTKKELFEMCSFLRLKNSNQDERVNKVNVYLILALEYMIHQLFNNN